MRPVLLPQHAMLLSDARPSHAIGGGAVISVQSTGWPFTVALLSRKSDVPLRALQPPPIALLTVADSAEGWPTPPAQKLFTVSRDRFVRESCAAKLPGPGSAIEFSLSIEKQMAVLRASGCRASARLQGSGERVSLAVWGAVDPSQVRLTGPPGLALALLQPGDYEPPASGTTAPACGALRDATARATIFTSADDAYVRKGGLNMMLPGFLREDDARLVVLGSGTNASQEAAAVRGTRGKMYRIRLKLTTLYRLLDACEPPEDACLGAFDADTVWLPGFAQRLLWLCRNWHAQIPEGGVLFHAEANVQPPQFSSDMQSYQSGFYTGLNGGGFFGPWRAVRDAIAAGMQLYGVSMRGVLTARHAPQQLLPLALQPYLNDQGSWMKLLVTQRRAQAMDGLPTWMRGPRIVLDSNATIMQAVFAAWGRNRNPSLSDAQKLRETLKRMDAGQVVNLVTRTRPIELHYNGPGREAHGVAELSPENVNGERPDCSAARLEQQVALIDYVSLARRTADPTAWCGSHAAQAKKCKPEQERKRAGGAQRHAARQNTGPGAQNRDLAEGYGRAVDKIGLGPAA